jgi:tripartite ATP-independent transporter DctM subunit
MLALPFVAMVIALLLGVPIAFSLAGAGILGIYLIKGDLNMILVVLGTAPFSTVADYALTTIPMFVLMAYFSASSGLAKDLFTATANWLSFIRGGLGVATVFACGIFGAMCGSSVAGASVMSTIAYPEMRRHGYSEELAAGTVGIGAVLNILIPPSIPMVIYGIATQTSIAKLLIAGVVPGIVTGIFLSLSILAWVYIRPQDAPGTFRVSFGERLASVRRIWPSLLLIAIIMLLLYTGIVTPTEVGAIGAFMAGLIGAAFGRLNWAGTFDALTSTISTCAMIFMVLIGAGIFGIFMTLSRVPQHVVAVVTDMNVNRWVVIIGIVVLYFVISMFMDEIPLLLLTLQLTFPLITRLGFDPIWFGVLSIMMVCMGLVFPPVGVVAFVVSATAKVDLMKVFAGTSVLMISIVIATILLMIFPQMALWLPATMR